LVLQLQRLASSSGGDLAELVRYAYLASSKLCQGAFAEWIRHEADGYGHSVDVPAYRKVRAKLVYWNIYHGECPIIINDSETEERISRVEVRQSIYEVADLVQRAKAGVGGFKVSISPEFQQNLWRQMRLQAECYLSVDASQLTRVVESFRTQLLDWALQLEALGVRGEGLSFSTEEVAAAKSMTIHISNSQGFVVGDVQGGTVSIQGYSSIHGELERAGVSKEERRMLEDLMDAHAKAQPQEKAGLAKQGLDWVMKNADKLGTLSTALRAWFGG